ncbi:MAG: winged helix-turn-helix domain-containing protein [Dehalococcoidales bacterium]|nr:winged helix-turn-helix domain-containing protein [Dehalococcoidales bacterium]
MITGRVGHSQRIAVSQRRSNIEIIADMLRVGENGAGKTEIMYSANMSYNQIQKYLRYLVSRSFIDEVKSDNLGIAYRVTESGSKLLSTIDNLIEMLGPGRNNQF